MSALAMRRNSIGVALAFVAGMLPLVSVMSAPDAAASGADTACSMDPTDGTVTRMVGARPYRLRVPPGLTGPSPLLLSLHGGGEPSAFHETETGWNGFAATQHFIVAYPEGINMLWDFGQGSPDVTYLRNVVSDIESSWCVDRRHVHAEGYSNGGSMANRLGCDSSDVFASFASYAGSDATVTGAPCAPSRPVANAQMDSALDPAQPFELQARSVWVNRNGCTNMQFEFSALAEVWHHRPCSAGTEVLWLDYYAGSHNWPIGPANADIRNRIWGLFVAQPLP